MDPKSKKSAGILFILLPTVAYGGFSLLGFLLDAHSGYMDNPLRQNLWRAGHAHAGVLIILSLVILKYIDEARLSEGTKQLIRWGVPSTAILIPAAFFFSMLRPSDKQPNGLIYLAYIGFFILIVTLITLGIGLLRKTD
ncbi:MAG: hypothetical protein C5B59_09375 [Bacteroidetes bacterium]|nr:MAG: hypothetical protein C5B59_09375 [Bacteroidota bacterium]